MFRRSSLTFGNAKSRVAAKGGKTTTDQLERAGRSIQAAINHWNEAANWKWLTKTTTVTVDENNVGTLPYDFKDFYYETSQGAQARPLKMFDLRDYIRNVWPNSAQPGPVVGYQAFLGESDGTFGLIPPVDSSATIDLAYYRNMVVPCTKTLTAVNYTDASPGFIAASMADVFVGNEVSNTSAAADLPAGTVIRAVTSERVGVFSNTPEFTSSGQSVSVGGDDKFLDIPAKYEWEIMAWAVHHYLSDLGAPDNRTAYWLEYSKNGLKEALRNNADRNEDMTAAILPPSPSEVVYRRNNIRR